jgi:hypothetical protein
MKLLLLLAACVSLEVACGVSTNFSQELLLSGPTPTGVATQRKEGSTQGVFMGRGMILNVRIRSSGAYAYLGDPGLGIFYRQYTAGNLGSWVNTAHLTPDDLPADMNAVEAQGSSSFYCGIYQSSTGDADLVEIIGGRSGMRMESDKLAIGGSPDTKAFIMVSAFGHTYTAPHSNGYLSTGQAYVFTGEYYHWTQVCVCLVSVSVSVSVSDYVCLPLSVCA